MDFEELKKLSQQAREDRLSKPEMESDAYAKFIWEHILAPKMKPEWIEYNKTHRTHERSKFPRFHKSPYRCTQCGGTRSMNVCRDCGSSDTVCGWCHRVGQSADETDCSKINHWLQIPYNKHQSSHGICPECIEKEKKKWRKQPVK